LFVFLFRCRWIWDSSVKFRFFFVK
jgi:hypothetical protein